MGTVCLLDSPQGGHRTRRTNNARSRCPLLWAAAYLVVSVEGKVLWQKLPRMTMKSRISYVRI